jgi:hypothetical protein
VTHAIFRDEQESYQRPDGMTVIARHPFCRDYFDYKPGQHGVFAGPSTFGKTTLAFDCLEYIASPSMPAYVAVSKPRDKTTQERGQALGFRRVEEWPPPVKFGEIEALGGQKPPGYLVWPHMGDLETDIQKCAELTRKLLMERYAAGANPKSKPGILVMDDTMIKAKLLGLDKEMVVILAMAAAMGLAMWTFVQRPSDSGRTPLWSYEMSIHCFFFKGGDKRMMARYMEIAGEHGPTLRRVIPTLEPFQSVYLNKLDNTMCIVGAK